MSRPARVFPENVIDMARVMRAQDPPLGWQKIANTLRAQVADAPSATQLRFALDPGYHDARKVYERTRLRTQRARDYRAVRGRSFRYGPKDCHPLFDPSRDGPAPSPGAFGDPPPGRRELLEEFARRTERLRPPMEDEAEA